MKKIIGVIILAAVVLTLIVPGAFAITDAQQKELDNLNKQMAELQKKMAQKYAEAGLITQEQADSMQQNIEQRSQIQKQFPNSYGNGYGCFGRGMMNGYGGRGAWGCW